MSHHRVSMEQLLAFAAGELDGEAAAVVKEFVDHDAGAARWVRLYRRASETVRTDDSVPVPKHLIEAAKSIFDPARLPQADVVPGMLDRIADAIATLVYDSRVALAGVRSGAVSQSYQLAYEAGEVDVELEIERQVGDPPATTDRWRVVGQVSAVDMSSLSSLSAVHAGTDDAIATAKLNEHGEFDIDLSPGIYDLHLSIGEATLVIRELNLR